MASTAAWASSLIDGIKVIDIDTHLNEPHDLWTKRAPAKLKNLVPRVADLDGTPTWIIGEDTILSGVGPGSISLARGDSSKSRSPEFLKWQIEDAHDGCDDTVERIKVMDDSNIFAQILYPNALDFGGQSGGAVDEALRGASVAIFNDAMADMQRESGNRIFPMALLPWWDRQKSVAEIRRVHAMGLRGVNMNSDPQNHDLPDLGDPYWDSMWEVCCDLDMPVNFHVGASESTGSWFGTPFWPSEPDNIRFALGSSMMFFSNARVMANIILSGILDRHPTIKFVSVESGIGWIPFLLETLEYQIAENAESARFTLTPREYFLRNIYSSFWFERQNLADSVRQVGVDNVMFETDFPHFTCLYPDPLEPAASGLAQLDMESRRKILSSNAAKLYSIPID